MSKEILIQDNNPENYIGSILEPLGREKLSKEVRRSPIDATYTPVYLCREWGERVFLSQINTHKASGEDVLYKIKRFPLLLDHLTTFHKWLSYTFIETPLYAYKINIEK